jgi:hypothetical protein
MLSWSSREENEEPTTVVIGLILRFCLLVELMEFDSSSRMVRIVGNEEPELDDLGGIGGTLGLGGGVLGKESVAVVELAPPEVSREGEDIISFWLLLDSVEVPSLFAWLFCCVDTWFCVAEAVLLVVESCAAPKIEMDGSSWVGKKLAQFSIICWRPKCRS